MVEHIVQILKKSRPNAPPSIVRKIPSLARRIEATLYVNAKTLPEYANRFTLETRMKTIALNSVSLRSKRQRQTPRNSSCDLVKLHNDHRKRANLNREESEPCVVACVSINGEKTLAFNFSKASGDVENRVEMPQDPVNYCEEAVEEDSDDFSSSSEYEDDPGWDGFYKNCEGSTNCSIPRSPKNDARKNCEALKLVYKLLTDLINEDGCISPQSVLLDLQGVAAPFLINEGKKRKLAEAIAHAMLHYSRAPEGSMPKPVERLDDVSEVVGSNTNNDQEETLEDKDKEDVCVPLSYLLNFCSENFARAPVDKDLLAGLVRLFCVSITDIHMPRVNKRALSDTIDRFVAADPKTVAPFVVERLVRKWPHKVSAQQVEFILQLESVFKCTDDATVHSLLPTVLQRISNCILHDNFHVANSAMLFGEKLVEYAHEHSSSERYNDTEKSALRVFSDNLCKNASTHWNPSIRETSKRLFVKTTSLFSLVL